MTETNNANLKQKTLKGFFWSFIDIGGSFTGQFIIGIILARLLTPADFGLTGMLTIFIAVGQSLSNSGFGQALIQNKETNQVDFSTVFYFNILTGLFLWIIIWFCAPYIAKFYNQPQLVSLAKYLCFSFVISSFGWIQQIHLTKSVEFKAQSLVGLISILVGGSVGIYFAYSGYGVWALVIQTLVKNAISALLFWKVSSWRPSLVFSFSSLKSLFVYGSRLLVGGLISTTFTYIYTIVIGRVFNAQSLGYYTRASQLKDTPILSISSIIQRVTFPVFSKIQDDKEKLIRGFRKSSRMLLLATLPMMMLLFLTASPLIHFLLTDKWMPVVPYLKIMCIYGWFYVLQTMNVVFITAKGRSDYYLKFQIIEKVLITIAIAVTFRYGIKVMLYGQMLSTILSFLVSSFYLRKVVDVKLKTQFSDIMPFLLSASLVSVITFFITRNINSDIINIITTCTIGSGMYLFFLWIFRVEETILGFNYLLKLIRNYFNIKVILQ